MAQGLTGKGIEVIYSRLRRAMRTAEFIAEKIGLEVHPDARLRERHLGTMQGVSQKDF